MLASLSLFACNDPQSYFDPHTQLHWMHCPVGQKYSHNQCVGTVVTMHWDESLRYCAELGVGQLEWRLASRNELMQYYAHYNRQKMAVINLYWSSSTDASNSELAWYLVPGLNWLYANLKELDGVVLCVAS